MIGRKLKDRYELLELLGQGAAGSVYKARDTQLERDVSVQVLSQLDNPARQNLVRSVEAAARLEHPNIAATYEVDEDDDGTSFVVTEYVEGLPLTEYIPSPPETVIHLGQQMASAMEYVHQHGLVHGDLHPDNIRVTPNGQIKIMELGLRPPQPSNDVVASGGITGHLAYLAPEQVKGMETDTRTDVYALGAVLYEMATGRPPFLANDLPTQLTQQVTVPPPSPRSISPDVPAALETVILKALEKQPENRYQSSDALASALTEGDQEETPAVITPDPKLSWTEDEARKQRIADGIATVEDFARAEAEAIASSPVSGVEESSEAVPMPDIEEGTGDAPLPEKPRQEEPPSDEGDKPDFDSMTSEEIMAWMESQAQRQGATEDFMAGAEMAVDDVEPGYVPSSIPSPEADPASIPEQADDEFSEVVDAELPDWQAPPDAEPAQEAEPGSLTEAPEWLTEQLSEAEPGSLTEAPDWLADEPAPEPAPGAIVPSAPPMPAQPVAAGPPAGSATDSTPVQFSAYYPREVERETWQPLHAYIYRQSASRAVTEDIHHQLGSLLPAFRAVGETARREIPQGEIVTATPNLPGFRFNPPSLSLAFYESWHRFDFKLQAYNAPLHQAANGWLTFSLAGVIVADIPLSVFVGEHVTSDHLASDSARLYQAIFCSYSHEDSRIVERVERAYKALGLDYLRDVISLRSGAHWSEELLELIDRADIFQLFWSPAAADSQYVRQEWEYALNLKREQASFIRPVYWQQPMPPPPEPMSHIHFAYQPDLDA